MKALIITAFASFFAVAVSAQTTTDTKAPETQTGARIQTQKPNTDGALKNPAINVRPVKVADSTTPASLTGNDKDAAAPANEAIETVSPADATKNAPAGVTQEKKQVNPGSQKLSTGKRDNAAPKE